MEYVLCVESDADSEREKRGEGSEGERLGDEKENAMWRMYTAEQGMDMVRDDISMENCAK